MVMRFAFSTGFRMGFGLILAAAFFGGASDRSSGQPPGPAPKPPGELPPLDPVVIDESVARAVHYLRSAQKDTGLWGEGDGKSVGSGGGWAVAYTSLVGLALIESGARPNDPAILRAARIVRLGAYQLVDTYEIALAILFLDKLKDPKRDDPLIRMLAARLIAGQTVTGGWKYKVPKLYEKDANAMMAALKKIGGAAAPTAAVSYRERPSAMHLCIKTADDIIIRPTKASLGAEDIEKKRTSVYKTLPQSLKKVIVFQKPGKLESLPMEERTKLIEAEKGDNSNVHFAMIGLWAARRHGVPTERVFELVARRYRTSQDGGSGGWGYGYPQNGSTPAMTCVALLGLAIGNALAVDPEAGRPEKDQAILKSLTYLSKNVGAPTGKYIDRPKVKDAGGLYYLWALERIAVLYDIHTLDKKDWYRWGAEILVANQLPDGSWKEAMVHGDHPAIDTALAILFLKRANLTPDLSKRLIVDSSALMAKVNLPKPPAPPPSLPPVPPRTEPPPEPPKAIEPPKPKEPSAPVVAAPIAAAPSEAPPRPTPPATPLWLWIAGGLGVILAICTGAFFAFRKRLDDDDDDDEDEDEGTTRRASPKTRSTAPRRSRDGPKKRPLPD